MKTGLFQDNPVFFLIIFLSSLFRPYYAEVNNVDV